MDAFLFYVFACFALLAGIMVIRAKNPVYSVLFLILVFCNVSGILLLLNLDFFAMVFLVVYVGAIAVLFLFVVMMLNVKLSEINDNILRYLPVGGIFGLLFLGQIVLVLEQDLLPIVAYHAQNVIPWIEYVSIISVFLRMHFMDFYLTTLDFFSVISQWQMHWKNLQTHLNTYASSVCLDVPTLDGVYYVIWPHSMEQTTTIQTLGHVVYTYYMVFFLLASIVLLIAMIGSIVLTMHKGVLVKRQDVFEQNTRDFSKTLHKIKSL